MPDYTNDGHRMTQAELHQILTETVARAIDDGLNMDIVYGVVSVVHRKTQHFFDENIKRIYKDVMRSDDA